MRKPETLKPHTLRMGLTVRDLLLKGQIPAESWIRDFLGGDFKKILGLRRLNH